MVVKQLKKVAQMVTDIEEKVEFFGDNDFLGSPPYANVDAFGKAWDLIKVSHILMFHITFTFSFIDRPSRKIGSCTTKFRRLRILC